MSEHNTREEILKLIEENGGPEGLDLSGKDLSAIDLSGEAIAAELEKAQERAPGEMPVWYSKITGGISLWSANLQGTRLVDANLQLADLGLAKLQEARLSRANLRGAFLVCADLRGAILADANLQRAFLMYSHLEGVDLFSVKGLEGAYFYNTFLDDTRLKRDQLGEEIASGLPCTLTTA